MTPEQIKNSDWAKKLMKESPVSYDQAIKFACSENFRVYIYRNTETGVPMWSIAACEDGHTTDFWMDSFKTKKEALALCKEMGWGLVK
jgi:hypothetical protein